MTSSRDTKTVVVTSIGTGGGHDFSTITLFEAALSNSDHFPQGSDVIAVCHDDSSFEEAVTLDCAPYGLKSMTLVSANGRRDELDWATRDWLESTRSIRFKN